MAKAMMRAVIWSFARLLRGNREPVSHVQLEHAHWDRDSRLWIEHEDERQAA
ncbi:MAG TPA: hypothetical protein VF137_07725 [Candidatus Dormibacteraeota bacterium]